MSLKNSSDIIGNRTRDLPTCSDLTQQTAPPVAPKHDLRAETNFKCKLKVAGRFLNFLKSMQILPPVTIRSVTIRWVSAAVLLSLKQNLMQVLCSLTPAISIFADTRENGVKKTVKTRKHVHL